MFWCLLVAEETRLRCGQTGHSALRRSDTRQAESSARFDYSAITWRLLQADLACHRYKGIKYGVCDKFVTDQNSQATREALWVGGADAHPLAAISL